ncbi:MAG: DNA mismatch endonuclease Vsr [Rhodospirillales bacterium]|nr:DNA mismatch endonuclease Vsr [Rhodospirillales bacterium]
MAKRKRNQKTNKLASPSEARSAIMRAVPSRNSKPELLVRRLAREIGNRFQSHKSSLPGSPDLAFLALQKVVFIHGCFWHGHRCRRGSRTPRTNRDYWIEKVARNKARDSRNLRSLRRMGWACLVVWECQLKDPDRVQERLRRFLASA